MPETTDTTETPDITGHAPATDGATLTVEPVPPQDLELDLDEYETPEVPARRAPLMTSVTWCLVVLLALSGGFAGGVFLQRRHTPAASAAATGRAAFGAAARAAAASAAGGATGSSVPGAAGAFPGAGAGGGTRGSVVLVDAANHAIYIQDASGNAIKVTVGPDTVMKVSNSTTDPSAYTVGATVTVTGAADADGNITATAITEGAVRGAGFGG